MSHTNINTLAICVNNSEKYLDIDTCATLFNSNIHKLENLPILSNDTLILIALNLDLPDLAKLCRTNKRLAGICSSERYWQMRVSKYFPDEYQNKEENENWKEYYRAISATYVYTFGSNNNEEYTPIRIPNFQGIKAISCGKMHTAILDIKGNVYMCGSNNYGQLGLGDEYNRNIPILIPNFRDVMSISCGGQHTAFIDKNGYVYMCGSNNVGQLGLKYVSNDPRNVPTRIPDIKAVAVSCGEKHTAIIDEEGYVYMCGSNNFGQLGLGDRRYRDIPSFPTRIPNFKGIQSISCGRYYTAFIDKNGNVFTFGHNYFGQLGLEDTHNKNNPTYVSNLQRIKVVAVSCGWSHTVCLDENGGVYTFGNNGAGQLGLGDKDNPAIYIPTRVPNVHGIAAISCGSSHTAIIDKNGYVYTFGNNNLGQLGLGYPEDDEEEEEHVYTPTIIPNFKNVKAISCGRKHTAVIKYN